MTDLHRAARAQAKDNNFASQVELGSLTLVPYQEEDLPLYIIQSVLTWESVVTDKL